MQEVYTIVHYPNIYNQIQLELAIKNKNIIFLAVFLILLLLINRNGDQS
jgi:hypothetical protein